MKAINAPGASPGDGRGLLVDHLRSFITLLVVAHHAVLAYHPYAPELGKTFDTAPMMWRSFEKQYAQELAKRGETVPPPGPPTEPN